MLEDYAAYYLQKYLGKYVKGVSKEALKISAWRGNVELQNMELKPEALVELKLPVKVKAGFLGSVKLKVPWSKLGQEPVIVELDRIFVLAEPSFKVEGTDDSVVQEARYQYIKDAETSMLNANKQEEKPAGMNNSWMGSLIGTIIANIKLSVTNIHIRYEDTESNPGHPFACGVTLEKLAAVTVDENGKEIFVSGGQLDKINKSGELKRLAVYFDSNSQPWDVEFRQLTPQQWSQVFEPGIKAEISNEKSRERHFLLQPVDGIARYDKLGNEAERTPDKPAQTAKVTLEDVTLCLSETQYRDTLKFVDNVTAFTTKVQYAHFRPRVSLEEDPRAWWQYALKATLEQNRKASGHLNWEELMRHARIRKKYVSLYAKLLLENPRASSITDNEEIRQLDRDLDKDVVVQWRVLAHTLADQARAQTAQKEREQPKKSWWQFGWGGRSNDDDAEPRNLTDEDWKQLNEAIGYEEGKPSSMIPGQDAPNMLHTVLEVGMHYNASKLLSEKGEEILDLSCEVLQTTVKLYSQAKEFDLKLQSYKIRSPEGLLGESANQQDALGCKFRYQPVDENLDWSLSAKASPCYITYYKSTVDRIMRFFQNKSAVSREVAIQTAAALQMTLDDVAKKTQQQLNDAMRNKPKFALFLDIAAPKLTIPTEFCPRPSQKTQLMVDLGHFTMKTETAEEQGLAGEEKELYMCFRMQLSDVSAFLADGQCGWDTVHNSRNTPGTLQVVHKCGVVAVVQQICAPHPMHPNTRVAVRLPSVALDFSPARYHRIMQIVEAFQSSSSDDAVRPWDPADCEGNISVLGWKGMGNREAVWKQRHGALAGPFLYILESPSAQGYEHCTSLIGKQVLAVPPEAVGGNEHVLAICDADQFSRKILESVNAVVLRFEDDESLNAWRAHFTAAIRKVSSSQGLARVSEIKQSAQEGHGPTMREKEVLFLIGALDELKLRVFTTKGVSRNEILLGEEVALLEARAIGSKVEFVMRESDMGVGAALLSLEVEDQWHGQTSSSCRYLARSTVNSFKAGDQETMSLRKRRSSGTERFFDSTPTFENDESSQNGGLSRRSSSQFYDADSTFNDSNTEQPPAFVKTPGLLPKLEKGALSYERNQSLRNFIKAQIIISSPEAPQYKNIDKQVKVSLTTLSFFVNRPTLLAIMGFVTSINANITESRSEPAESSEEPKDVQSAITPVDIHDSDPVATFDRKDSVVKGLLGTGKDRVLFLLVLDMDRAQVILNRDDGAQLGTLSQENLHVTVKMFPSTYAVSAALGNLRVTDDGLREGHPYHHLVDMRDPAGKSFVELEFISYCEDDDDYQGFEFSLSGKLSELRVVYLNRFIQEISAYFMGLVPANADYVVKLKDKVTDAEKNFTQSEVEGAPAFKVEVSLDRPVILFPRDTDSNSFLELDILHIEVSNTFQWLGGGKEDIDAVRLETDVLKIEDIHLVVAVNGETGQNIIRESSGIFVTVRRTLRDLQHQLAAVDAAIELKTLKAGLSDKEYQVMIDCFTGNLSEVPRIPPPLANTETDGSQEEKDKGVSREEGAEGGPGDSEAHGPDENQGDHSNKKVWTTVKVTADVSLVELHLLSGRTNDTPLASVQVSSVWAAFRMTTDEEKYVMLTLDAVSVTDDRDGVEPELRFMIGKADHVGEENSRFVMLVMDAKLGPTSQMITLRLQRPRVLLALDFLLAVAEFFIPSVADMIPSGNASSETPYDMKHWIFLDKSPYIQDSDEVELSTKHALVADHENIDKYVYDGRGGRLRLTKPEPGNRPLIMVGHGKSLRFRNIIIQNASYLETSLLLGSNSSYSVSQHDGVYLEYDSEPDDADDQQKPNNSDKPESGSSSSSVETTFDLQAIGPELMMYAASLHSSQVRDRLLCARMDVFSRLVMKADDIEVSGKIDGFSVEGRRGLYAVEPIDSHFRYSKVSGKQNIHLSISDIVSNMTFSTLQLILKLQEDAQSLLLLTSKKITVECTEFDQIWVQEVQVGSSQIAFWRPRVPPGFAVLGDCLTVIDEPPSKGVLALNMNLAHVKRPEGFSFMWSSGGKEECSVWLPKAPEGYVALGCVATTGRSPPQPSSVLCVAKHLVTQWYMRDCIVVKTSHGEQSEFWRAGNSTGSFLYVTALTPPLSCLPYELRHVALDLEQSEQAPPSTANASQSGEDEGRILFTNTTRFKLVWWDKDTKSKKPISIWRPVMPVGCALFGDIAVEGYEPPGVAFVPLDAENALLQKPVEFMKLGVLHERKGVKKAVFWFPVAPPGYVALGCLTRLDSKLDEETSQQVRCVRSDLVREVQFSSSSLWDGKQIKHLNQDISIWPLQIVDNESKASTFVVNTTSEPPPKHLAFQLKDLGENSSSDSIIGDVEVKQCLATVYDDFGGLMIPLVNVSLNGVTTSLHGKTDLMKTTTNFSLLANTYNGKSGSWEPLIENTETHLRYSQESFPFSSSSLSQVSIAVTSSMNVNLSTANLNLLLGAYESWNKLQSIQSPMKGEGVHGQGADQILEHEHEKKLTVACYNNLGQQLFCRLLDDKCNVKVVSLSSGQTETFRMPSMMSLRDPATRKAIKQKNVKLLSFKIGTAKIPRDGGFGGRQYMVALRIIPQLQTADQHQLQYQSARTRSMNPSEAGDTVTVSWEEVFIFELELTKSYTAELLITDFAKGAAVGYCSVALESLGRHDFQGHEPWSSPRMERHSLHTATAQQRGTESIGWLSIGYKYLSTGTEPEDENLMKIRQEDLDIGSIQVALSSSGPWTKLYLNLASKSSYLNISGEIAASELTMEGGNKHLTIRSPVVIKNKTRLRLEVSLFPQSATREKGKEKHSEHPSASVVEEEVFENQRYQPLAGWGSSWPGHLMPTDPGRWSRRDLTDSSQEFLNVELPLGWEWSTDWYVDAANTLDEEGWAYAFSFKSLKEYPFPTSSQKMSFVRRRRWVRKRHRTSTLETARCVLGTLNAGEATAMPIACFREARQDYILQLKPADDADDYGWTQVAVCHEHGEKKPSTGDIHVRSLLKDEALSSCLLEAATPTRSKWFCMDAVFTDIGRDVHAGIVKDCELTVTAPLKILNHLPVSAEYCIFYASRVRGYKLQDKGRVVSGETAEIYNADIRKALYLSFIPDGSWEHEKDPVLISHPHRNAAKSMILQNVATKRTITVHIEYDYDEKEATSKVLRISVPYWVDCCKCPPLRLRILHIASETKNRCLPETSAEPELLEFVPEDELRNSYIMVSPFNLRASAFSASLAVDDSGIFGPIAPLADLEEVDGTVQLIAFNGTTYFRLLVSTNLCPIKFAHTKVVTIRPYVTFTNRFGETLMLKQASSDDPNTLATSDWRKSFPVSVVEDSAMVQVSLESSQWSFPIRIDQEESLHFYLVDESRAKHFVRMEIRGYQEGSRYVVVFRKGSFRGPYRVENRTASKKIRFRQLGTLDDDWELLYPTSTRTFDWRDPCGQQVLELLPDNVELDKSIKVALENCAEEQVALDLRVRVVQLRHLKAIKIMDAEEGTIEQHKQTSPRAQQGLSQLKVVLDVGRLGVSIIDQRPQEILFLFMEDLKFSVLFSSQEDASRFKLRIGYLQLDDQNLLTPLPVIFAPESRELAGEEYVFKTAISMLDNKDDATKVFPHMGVWVTKRAWCINVHEPVIWTALAMYRNLHLDVLSSNSEVAGVDPEIRINLIDVSGARLKLTLQTETSQRPRGVLGIWSPVVSLLGNTSKMPIHISGATVQNRYMRQSEISTQLLNHLRKDVVHQAFQLLFGVNVLGMASSTLETLSKTAADLSQDDQFRQFRTRQDRLKYLNGVGDGVLRGGEALARGFAFGLSGVVTKPVSNARQSGVTGFFQGIGKGFAGFVLQPISGMLDFIALTIDGVNISYTRCFDAFKHDRGLTRIRLPRAIRGDGIILPYDERAALGQAMMQLAEAHHFGQNVIFKESAKFSLTDFYEDHFELPENKVAVISNRRVMLLTRPSSYKSIRNVVPSKPCRLWWEVPFTELLTLEVARKSGGQTPVYVILHLRNNSKMFAQVIKCFSSSDAGTGPSQADQVYSSIESRWRKYGPERKALLSQMMRKGQSKSMPTPRASKRAFVSDEERSKGLSDASDGSASSSRVGEQSASERLVKEVILFEQIWRSEEEPSACCSTFPGLASESNPSCTIWRPIVPEGYVSVGDVAYRGTNPPTVTASYKNKDGMFAQPKSFHLVWRNWKDELVEPITIWRPIAPAGYVALGCVAVCGYMEPEPSTVWCAREDIVETSEVDEQPLWQATHPWHCYIHQVSGQALTFLASRERKTAESRAHRVVLGSRRKEERMEEEGAER